MKLRGLARLALMIVPVAGAAGTAALPRMARAAVTTITVTTTTDDPSADCTGLNGCSLQQAVLKANSDSGDVIQLKALTYDVTIAADPQLSDDGHHRRPRDSFEHDDPGSRGNPNPDPRRRFAVE